MSHGYVRNHYGDNCHFPDSSYKRYNRCHAGGGDILIFNNNHSHCQQGRGAFWFGMFTGFASIFTGWAISGGNNYNSYDMWGDGYSFDSGKPGTSQSDRADRAARYAAANNGKSYGLGNKDTETLAGFNKRLDTLIEDKLASTNNAGDDTIDKLIADIEAKIEKQDDDVQNSHDITNYDSLLARAKEFRDGKIAGVDSDVIKITDTGITIIIDGTKVESLADLNKVDDEVLRNMSPQTATVVLLKLGYIAKDNFSTKHWSNPQPTSDGTTDYLCGKASPNGRIMLLLSRANVAVELVKGRSGTNVDNWVTGLVSDVAIDDNTGELISCSIDCRNTGESGYRGKYKFEKKDGGYELSVHDENTRTTVYNGSGLEYDTEKKYFHNGRLIISKK